MRKIFAGCMLLLSIHQPLLAQTTITGFTDKTAADQKQLEQKFDAQLNAQRIGATIKELSARPHHVGSPGGKEVAEKILDKLKSYGWDAKIETYQVLFPTPKTRVLEMIAPSIYKAILKEPG
jgi:N-acetylated-alpha-linked acidic dipeptidase